MPRAAQLRPLAAAALRRRALASRSGARRACSSQASEFYVDEAHWPLYGGAVLAVGCLIGGLVVRRESFLRKAQGKVARKGRRKDTASTGAPVPTQTFQLSPCREGLP